MYAYILYIHTIYLFCALLFIMCHHDIHLIISTFHNKFRRKFIADKDIYYHVLLYSKCNSVHKFTGL